MARECWGICAETQPPSSSRHSTSSAAKFMNSLTKTSLFRRCSGKGWESLRFLRSYQPPAHVHGGAIARNSGCCYLFPNQASELISHGSYAEIPASHQISCYTLETPSDPF